MFVPLSELAVVSLGFKSLQNSFYYVNKATIDTFGIEKRFLTPILMLRALYADRYLQSPKELCAEVGDGMKGKAAYRGGVRASTSQAKMLCPAGGQDRRR